MERLRIARQQKKAVRRKRHLESSNAPVTTNNVLQLQRIIGNRVTHQLVQQQGTQQTALQRNFDFRTFLGSFFGLPNRLPPLSQEAVEKATRVNKRYATNPPVAGWPYRADLRTAWEAGNYAEFARLVREFQVNTMGLSADDKDADGILGKNTAMAMTLRKNSSDIGDAPAPTAVTSASAPAAAPSAETTPAAPTATPAGQVTVKNHIAQSSFVAPKFDATSVSDFDSAMALFVTVRANLTQAMVDKNEAETETQKKLFEETKTKLRTLADTIFGTFDSEVGGSGNKFGMPVDSTDRVRFLDHMAQYFGSTENAVKHYQRIRKAEVPGVVYLHDDAATQIEAVYKELGDKMPSTTVALGIRGRYSPHKRTSKGRMAHPAGYAIDYFANSNVYLDDSRMRALVNLHAAKHTGGPAYLKMQSQRKGRGDDKMESSERRSLITKIENGTLDQSQTDTFFAQFEDGYKRVAQASSKFRDSLGTDGVDKLRAVQQRYFEVVNKRRDVAAAMKKEKKKKKAEQNFEPMEKELKVLQETEDKIQQDAQVILKPWYDLIAERRTVLNTEIAKTQDKKQQAVRQKELDILLNLETLLKGDLQRLLGSPMDKPTRAERKAGLTRSMTLKQQPSFEAGLSFFQLMDQGYFSPNDKGFEINFLKTMIRHGFDLGVFWDASDAMHLELVRGVDAIPDPGKDKVLQERLDKFKARYPFDEVILPKPKKGKSSKKKK